MIDNNNQYAEYSNKDLRDKWDASSWQWLWDADVRPTIESLRQVARAADAVVTVGAFAARPSTPCLRGVLTAQRKANRLWVWVE